MALHRAKEEVGGGEERLWGSAAGWIYGGWKKHNSDYCHESRSGTTRIVIHALRPRAIIDKLKDQILEG